MAEEQTRESRLPADARRDSGIFMLLLATTVLLYMLSIPLAFGVIATGTAAAVIGLRALYRTRSTPQITTYRYAMIAGVLVSLFAVFMGVVLIVFREPVQNLQECMSRAITQSAEATCQSDYQTDVEDLVDDALDRVGLTRP